jgi:hypothetical protein
VFALRYRDPAAFPRADKHAYYRYEYYRTDGRNEAEESRDRGEHQSGVTGKALMGVTVMPRERRP